MFVLGIHGWYKRVHDPSACLVKNGRILAMAEEERFDRQKHAFDKFPINAIGYCLNEAKISPDKIDIIALGWDYRLQSALRNIKFHYSNDKILKLLLPPQKFKYKKKPRLIIVPHHMAHAASVFFTSGLKESSILVMDGQGEDSSTSIAYGKNKRIKILKSFPIKNSLGYFYESVNKYIGFRHYDSGKTMGLAPYGKPGFNFKNIRLRKYGYNISLPGKLRYSSQYFDEQEPLEKLWHKKIKEFVKSPNDTEYRFDKFRDIFDFKTLTKWG